MKTMVIFCLFFCAVFPFGLSRQAKAVPPDDLDLSVIYKGQADTLQLTRYSLRSAGFFVNVWRTDHFEAFVPSVTQVYRGTLANHPEISVIAQVTDAGLQEAMVVLPDGLASWMIEEPTQSEISHITLYIFGSRVRSTEGRHAAVAAGAGDRGSSGGAGGQGRV